MGLFVFVNINNLLFFATDPFFYNTVRVAKIEYVSAD